MVPGNNVTIKCLVSIPIRDNYYSARQYFQTGSGQNPVSYSKNAQYQSSRSLKLMIHLHIIPLFLHAFSICSYARVNRHISPSAFLYT
jgi:hypothetical protein